MRYRLLKLFARQYRLDTNIFIRRDIVREVFKSERMVGLEVLGKMVGCSVQYLYKLGEIDQLRKERNLCRRQRKLKNNLSIEEISQLRARWW